MLKKIKVTSYFNCPNIQHLSCINLTHNQLLNGFQCNTVSSYFTVNLPRLNLSFDSISIEQLIIPNIYNLFRKNKFNGVTSTRHISMQNQKFNFSHKKHRPIMETIAKRIQQQKKRKLPQHEQIYLEKIRININNQKIPVKVDKIPWQLRNRIVSKTIIWHRKLKLNKSVLFDSIISLDRLISLSSIQQLQSKFELIILTILNLSYKREQNCRKNLNNWMETIQFCKYSAEQIILKQLQALEALDYNLEFTNSFDFMSFIVIDMDINENTLMLARYFLQLSFFLNYQRFYQFINYQGLIGATALYLSCHFLQPTQWNTWFMNRLNVTQEMLEDCASMLFEIILQVNQNSPFSELLKPVQNKYMKKCYLEVANIKFESIKSQPSQQTEFAYQKDKQKELQSSNSSTAVSRSPGHNSLRESSSRCNFIAQESPQKIQRVIVREIRQTRAQQHQILRISRRIIY